jgi:hypothetical protein
MIHTLKLGGDEFKIHAYDFGYSTPDRAGLPAEQASNGRMRVAIHEDGNDKDSDNYKKARSALWKRTVEAPSRTQSDLKEEITLTIRQKGGLPSGERVITFKGWVTSFRENTLLDSHDGGFAAGQGVVECVLFVWPKSGDYMPSVR